MADKNLRINTTIGLTDATATGANSAKKNISLVTNTLNDLKNAAIGFLGVGLLGRLGAGLITAGDKYIEFAGRIKLTTKSVIEQATAAKELIAISLKTSTSLRDNVDIYRRTSDAYVRMGKTQKDVFDATEALSLAVQIAGDTAETAGAGIYQWNQAVASGTLRGAELNSTLEQLPRVAKALTDGLGVSIGKLREMAANGELTSELITSTLQSQLAVLRDEAASILPTFGRAIQYLETQWVVFSGELNNSSKFMGILAAGVKFLANNLDLATRAVAGLIVWLAGKGIAATLSWANAIRLAGIAAQEAAAAYQLQTEALAKEALAKMRSIEIAIKMNAERVNELRLQRALATATTDITAIETQLTKVRAEGNRLIADRAANEVLLTKATADFSRALLQQTELEIANAESKARATEATIAKARADMLAATTIADYDKAELALNTALSEEIYLKSRLIELNLLLRNTTAQLSAGTLLWANVTSIATARAWAMQKATTALAAAGSLVSAAFNKLFLVWIAWEILDTFREKSQKLNAVMAVMEMLAKHAANGISFLFDVITGGGWDKPLAELQARTAAIDAEFNKSTNGVEAFNKEVEKTSEAAQKGFNEIKSDLEQLNNFRKEQYDRDIANSQIAELKKVADIENALLALGDKEKIHAYNKENELSKAAQQGNNERIALLANYNSERLRLLDENFANEKIKRNSYYDELLKKVGDNNLLIKQNESLRLKSIEALNKEHLEARKVVLKELYDAYTKSIDDLIGLEAKHRDKALEYANEILDLYKTQAQKLFEIDQIGLTEAEVIANKRKLLAELESKYAIALKNEDYKTARELAEQKNALAEELFKNEKNRKAEIAKLDKQEADAKLAYDQKIADISNDDPKGQPEKIADAQVELNNKLREIALERQKIGQQTDADITKSKDVYIKSTDDIATAIDGLKGVEQTRAGEISSQIAQQTVEQEKYKAAIEETNKTLLSGLKTLTIDLQGEAALKTADDLNKALDNAARPREVVLTTKTVSSNEPPAKTSPNVPSLDTGGGVYEDGLAMIHKNEFMLNPTGTKIASQIFGAKSLAGMNAGNVPKVSGRVAAAARRDSGDKSLGYFELGIPTPQGVIKAKADDSSVLRQFLREVQAKNKVS